VLIINLSWNYFIFVFRFLFVGIVEKKNMFGFGRWNGRWRIFEVIILLIISIFLFMLWVIRDVNFNIGVFVCNIKEICKIN